MYLQPIGSPLEVSVATGKIVTNFTITVSSAIPSHTPITCNVSASVSDFNTSTFAGYNFLNDSATVIATRSAGSARCTVTIPYSWNLSYRSTDQVSLSYNIDAGPCGASALFSTQAIIGSGSRPDEPLAVDTTRAGRLVDRCSSQNLAPITSIPTDGATTTETVKATI